MHGGPSPFVAASGARPPHLAGRVEQLAAIDVAIERLGDGQPARTIGWIGLRGSGRTAIGHEAAKRAARLGWAPAIVSVERGGRLEHDLARGVAAALLHHRRRHPAEERIGEMLGAARAYAGHHGLDLPVDGPDAEISWPGTTLADAGALLERIADGLRSIGAGCLLVFDDVELADPTVFAALFGAAALIAGAGKPALLAATALPGSVRLDTLDLHPLGALGPADVDEALTGPAARQGVSIGRDTVAAIGRRTDGHPLFVQAFAAHAWQRLDGPDLLPEHVADAAFDAEQDLRATFFSPVLDGLTPAELRFARALADEGGAATFDQIARRLGDPVRFDPATSRLAPVRDALLRDRVLIDTGDGLLRLAVPYLERYLRVAD